MGIITWIVFGALVGWIASLIMKTDEEQGAVANIIIGIVGAFIGGSLSSLFNGPGVSGFNVRSLLLSIAGALILIFFIRMLGKGHRRNEV